MDDVDDVTRILNRMSDGQGAGPDELLPLVYLELRRMAANRLRREAHAHTIQATELVHDAWLRIAGGVQVAWVGRQHFYSASAEIMRRILVDRARRRLAAKRGGNVERVDADEMEIPSPGPDDLVVALADALERFARIEPRKAEVVKLRYFAGFSFEDTATALGIAVPTAKQWWAYGRAWLRVEMDNSK